MANRFNGDDIPKHDSQAISNALAAIKKSLGIGALSLAAVPIESRENLPPIPEPPEVLDIKEELVNQLNALGEPTFASLGLGGWTPAGIVQQCFEYFHVSLGVPWWAAIVIGK